MSMKSKELEEMSPKKQKILKVCSIIAIIAIILLGVMEWFNRQTQKSVNALYDTTVIDYEAYTSGLNNLVYIYSIWDEESYKYAEKNCNISSELRSEIFVGYTGSNYKTKPTVTVTDIQYDLEADVTGVRTYYAVLKIKNNDTDKIIYYNIIAVLKEDTLIDYTVL